MDLTNLTTLKLKAYKLDKNQWTLAKKLNMALNVFKGPTLLFSRVDIPLISEAIPMLEDMKNILHQMSEDTTEPSSIRIAAHALLMLAQKYYSLFDQCEVYCIAIAMCPDKKLKWFEKCGWSAEDIAGVCKLVITRWNESYKGADSQYAAPPDMEPTTSWWEVPTSDDDPLTSVEEDSIETYLDEPPVYKCDIAAAGGLLKYWFNSQADHPCLSNMGEDFCSAPASSTDPERSLLDGCQQINFMQHNTVTETFQAEIAVGSWDGSPIFPNLQEVIDLMGKRVKEQKVKGYGDNGVPPAATTTETTTTTTTTVAS